MEAGRKLKKILWNSERKKVINADLISRKISFKNEGKIKIFSDEIKPKVSSPADVKYRKC